MCGIAGIIGRLGEENRAALRRMSRAQSHRGPDGEGFWEAAPDAQGWGVLLAHRRLSILDLSPTGAQPMTDPATGHTLVMNGEIYNYVELRNRLAAQGQPFRSSGDTEVMLHTLVLRGRAGAGALRGMFAFALWDPRDRNLHLARDPLGMKPLYLARNPDPRGTWSVIFASEVRALLASGLLSAPKLDLRAVASVAWNGFVVGPGTAVAGVEAVWPGQLRTFDGAGREEEPLDFARALPASASPPVGEEELARVLRECVRLHMASDVPLGIFLSGGVDSSAVAHLAKAASETPVHTFTLTFEEQELNEGPIARRVAEAIGTHHEELLLTQADFIAGLESALDCLDQPTFDGINSYYMSHAVRRAGIKVALVGTGGDELFGGYTSFRDLPYLLHWSSRARWIPIKARVAFAKLAAAVMHPSRGAVPRQTRWAKLPEMVRRGDDLLALYQLAYALFLPDFQRDLLGADRTADLVEGLPRAMHQRLQRAVVDRSPLAAISVLEQRLFLGERLLRDTDAASMSASIEVRLPLVDQVLFQTADRLPDHVRYHPLRRKAILRRVGLRGLDPQLFERPKSGFVLPFDRWIRAGLGKVMDATMRDPQAVRAAGLDAGAVGRLWQAFLDGAPGIYWSRVWALYVLIRWCQRNDLSA